MRTIITIGICLFLSSLQAQKQETTLEEYNYLTKGYKIAMESGLDMKSGYRLEEGFAISKSSYKFTFRDFIRTADTSYAGTLVIVFSSVSQRTYYIAIPCVFADQYGLLSVWESQFSQFDAALLRNFLLATLSLQSSISPVWLELMIDDQATEKYSKKMLKKYRLE